MKYKPKKQTPDLPEYPNPRHKRHIKSTPAPEVRSRRVTSMMTPQLHETIKGYAWKSDVSMGYLIEQALVEYIRNHPLD